MDVNAINCAILKQQYSRVVKLNFDNYVFPLFHLRALIELVTSLFFLGFRQLHPVLVGFFLPPYSDQVDT